jgi:hypothetical protein
MPTIDAYLQAFAPVSVWDDLAAWPPDVFAVANLVLHHTEAYRFAVAPLPGRRWPPVDGWDDAVRAAADAWRVTAGVAGEPPPAAVGERWRIVVERRSLPLDALRRGDEPELANALLTLHAMADEASAGLAAAGPVLETDAFERRAWAQLEAHGSLANFSPARVRVLPKTHLAARGLTIRSFSRYLALCYEAVEVRWRRTEAAARWRGRAGDDRDFDIVILPWPLDVRAGDFRAVDGTS